MHCGANPRVAKEIIPIDLCGHSSHFPFISPAPRPPSTRSDRWMTAPAASLDRGSMRAGPRRPAGGLPRSGVVARWTPSPGRWRRSIGGRCGPWRTPPLGNGQLMAHSSSLMEKCGGRDQLHGREGATGEALTALPPICDSPTMVFQLVGGQWPLGNGWIRPSSFGLIVDGYWVDRRLVSTLMDV